MATADAADEGWKVMGAVAAANVSPYRRAKSWEEPGTLRPQIVLVAAYLHTPLPSGGVDDRSEALQDDLRALLALGVSREVTRHRVGEIRVAEPSGERVLEELAELALGVQDLAGELCPAVEYRDDVLHILAGPEVALTPASERLDFGGDEEGSGGNSNHGPVG